VVKDPFPDKDICRSCGAEIRWARTVAGKRIPLDPQPVEGGNLAPTFGPVGQILVRVVGRPWNGRRWRSHFATCPNRNAHRAGRKPKRP
jgi:hypothetical protein